METLDLKKYALHLFIAYDLKFTNTELNDYQITDEEILSLVDSVHYLGRAAIANEAADLVEKEVITTKEAKLIFGEGYGMKRNAVLYFALINKMDHLIFFDDDEYPVANVRMDDRLVWEGQAVLAAHIQSLQNADITNGHHCGYISPVPGIEFNDILTEQDFRTFIEAISNDIISWESIQKKRLDGGITYADPGSMADDKVCEVEEIHGMKFISGANLGINLRDTKRLFPFYNPPGARGEDTFLSTCIIKNKVLKIPCYTFHDGFAVYGGLLSGVLPNSLKSMKANSSVITRRFLRAAVGWTRYKPLLIFVTQNEKYEVLMEDMKNRLEFVLPKLCSYYGSNEFAVISDEFKFYREHVKEHYQDFEDTKKAWRKIMNHLDRCRKYIADGVTG